MERSILGPDYRTGTRAIMESRAVFVGVVVFFAVSRLVLSHFNGVENSLYAMDGVGLRLPAPGRHSSNRNHARTTAKFYGHAVVPRTSWAEKFHPAAACRPRQLSLCDDVLPYNSTLLPNLVGDRDRISLNRTLLFFALMLKTECNPRLKQLLCSLLEPPCRAGRPLLPCRKFCKATRAVMESRAVFVGVVVFFAVSRLVLSHFNGVENSLYAMDGVGLRLPAPGRHSSNRNHARTTAKFYGHAVVPRTSWAEKFHPAAACRPRQLSLCDDVLPYNSTLLPNLVGDRDRISLNRTLLFFALMLKTECNPRLKQLLCSLLEPPCRAGRPLLPCRKFCKVATENCQKLIPATLALSRVFDCRRYPDSDSPSVCLNLARSASCLRQEHQCPDLTCIPRQWRCDGVRDCPLAADEANCTDGSGRPTLDALEPFTKVLLSVEGERKDKSMTALQTD
ncbi:atrial natriuretic peptide-converting enzyme-like [Ixodes scapularis]